MPIPFISSATCTPSAWKARIIEERVILFPLSKRQTGLYVIIVILKGVVLRHNKAYGADGLDGDIIAGQDGERSGSLGTAEGSGVVAVGGGGGLVVACAVLIDVVSLYGLCPRRLCGHLVMMVICQNEFWDVSAKPTVPQGSQVRKKRSS